MKIGNFGHCTLLVLLYLGNSKKCNKSFFSEKFNEKKKKKLHTNWIWLPLALNISLLYS